ncbi:MAG: toluene tolerance protein [Alphaproteobacteria bacterium]|nr:toluene tolerance protein [Alphaproteobacteria bacterium]
MSRILFRPLQHPVSNIRPALRIAVVAAALCGLFGSASAATSPQGAAQFIQWLGDQAISTLGSTNSSLEQREASVRELMRQGFALQFIGRFVLGRHWRKVTPDQRAQYQQLFASYILQTYSSHLGGYSGESLSIKGAKPAGSKDAIVQTRIVRPSAPPIDADWRVRAQGNQYMIIDVAVEGVSMAVTQRSEFASVIKNHGFDGLLAALRARTDKMPASAH